MNISYALLFKLTLSMTLKLFTYTYLFEFFLTSFLISSFTWFLYTTYSRKYSNDYLRTQIDNNQKVEWFYAFDIHCNSFFPYFLIVHVLQFVLSPLIYKEGEIATIISSVLYFVAFSYYWYITFRGLIIIFIIGYVELNYLKSTEKFLFPILILLIFFLFCIIFQFNLSIFMMKLYF
jgi:hypothetical protein